VDTPNVHLQHHGWLTDINNVNGTEFYPFSGRIVLPADPYDLVRFKVSYQTVTNAVSGNVVPLYNGNISETSWRTQSDNVKRAYCYKYDGLNRLHAAYYQKPNDATPITGSYNENVKYDKNGNIMFLNRTGDYDDAAVALEIDSLAYGYDAANPNRLNWVNDRSNNTSGFNDGVVGTAEYTYDANGNMTADANKGITSITYNPLNLPLKITLGGGTISYLYDALGQKVQKTVIDTAAGTTTTTDYLDRFQYQCGDDPIPDGGRLCRCYYCCLPALGNIQLCV
jgi:YD repeat-containing protein